MTPGKSVAPAAVSVRTLEREQLIARPRGDVFAFFADATNLERLTPPSLHFRICGALPEQMVAGTIIDYQLSLFGVPFAWRTLIEVFQPEACFVDVQQRGPYRHWRHTHRFEETPEGTLVRDHVAYVLPLGTFGDVSAGFLVRRQLAKIFDFRAATLARIFP